MSPVLALRQDTHRPTSFSARVQPRGSGRARPPAPWSLPTYAGRFTHLLTQALGGNEEIQEEAQPVPLEVRIQETENLPQDGGRRGLKRGIEACQGMLDGCVQGWGILWGTGGEYEK